MASPFPKFLPLFTTTAALTFAWKEGSGESLVNKSCSVAAGTYSTILAFLSALDTAIGGATAGTHSVTVSSVGYVTVAIQNATQSFWEGCSADMKSLLGFAGTEAFAASVTATSQHQQGWYPGALSYGTSDGESQRTDSLWTTEKETGAALAGNGAVSLIGPARRLYIRTIAFGPLHSDEVKKNRLKGVSGFHDRWRSVPIRWYPDRSVGTVAVPGTGMDPGPSAFDVDGDHDYWTVRLYSAPRITQNGGSSRYWDVALELVAAPL